MHDRSGRKRQNPDPVTARSGALGPLKSGKRRSGRMISHCASSHDSDTNQGGDSCNRNEEQRTGQDRVGAGKERRGCAASRSGVGRIGKATGTETQEQRGESKAEWLLGQKRAEDRSPVLGSTADELGCRTTRYDRVTTVCTPVRHRTGRTERSWS